MRWLNFGRSRSKVKVGGIGICALLNTLLDIVELQAVGLHQLGDSGDAFVNRRQESINVYKWTVNKSHVLVMCCRLYTFRYRLIGLFFINYSMLVWLNYLSPKSENALLVTGPLTHSVLGPVSFCFLSSVVVCRRRLSSSVTRHGGAT